MRQGRIIHRIEMSSCKFSSTVLLNCAHLATTGAMGCCICAGDLMSITWLMLQIKDLILRPQLLKDAAEKLTEEQRRCMWPPEIGHQYHNYLTNEFDKTQLAAIEVRSPAVCSLENACRNLTGVGCLFIPLAVICNSSTTSMVLASSVLFACHLTSWPLQLVNVAANRPFSC